MRKEVLREHVPSVPFVDYAPQQLPEDDEAIITPRDLQRGISTRPTARMIATQLYEGVFDELG
jgi:Phosphotransferase system, mannitol-specific IIBC component